MQRKSERHISQRRLSSIYVHVAGMDQRVALRNTLRIFISYTCLELRQGCRVQRRRRDQILTNKL
jgi:hypothetical protein